MVVQKNKAIFENIWYGVIDKCLIRFKSSNSDAAQTFKLSIRKYYECLVDAMGKTSTTNGLTDEWTKFQPQFRKHFDLWNECDNAGGKLKAILYV